MIPRPTLSLAVLYVLLFVLHACAQTLVNCPIDCNSTPDVAAEIELCLQAQALLMHNEIKVVPNDEWLAVLGVVDQSTITKNSPTSFTWQATMQVVQRVDCKGLLNGRAEYIKNKFFFICIKLPIEYVDPLAQVIVSLSGICPATLIGAPGVGSVSYSGPATISGPGLPLSPYNHAVMSFEALTFDGGGTTSPVFADCKTNSNVSIDNSTFIGWTGDKVLDVEACDPFVEVQFTNLHMVDVPGTPIDTKGLYSLRVTGLYCERCVTRPGHTCVIVGIYEGSRGYVDVYGNNCFPIADMLPPRCRYCLTGDAGFCGSRCNEGVVQVYDRDATAEFANCPMIDFTFIDYFDPMGPLVTIQEFDPLCRVWRENPQCNFIAVTDSQNFTRIIQFGGGDIIWTYDAPLICVPGGDISPLTGPFFLTGFDNALGDPVALAMLPPLPAPPAFVDPSFENVGTIWTEGVLTNPDIYVGNILVFSANKDVISNAPQPARTGSWLMRCDNDALKTVGQPVQASLSDVGNPRTLEFWGRRQSGQQFRYASRFMRLLIDGAEQDRIDEPTFSTTLVNDNQYYLFTMVWTPADTLVHTLTLECNFLGGADAVTLRVDDVAWQAPWAGSTLLDPSFEYHALDWQDTPVGGVVLNEDDTPCPARTGSFVVQCGAEGENRLVTQSVLFPQDGVYAVMFNAQRRNSIGNYAGLSVDIVDAPNIFSINVLGTLSIDLDHLPTQDDYYAVYGEGGILISGAPLFVDLGFHCDFTGAPGGDANLCIDDVSIVSIGTVGIVPVTTGFSSQQISSAPFIVNQTCDCANFTAPARNATTFPCAYALDPATVCIEEVPSCCATPLVAARTVLPHVLYGNNTCYDLNQSPPCVMLLDCIVLLTGELVSCREFTCPYNASEPALPVQSLPDPFSYILTTCTENTPIPDASASLLYFDLVVDYAPGVVQYLPVPDEGVVTFNQAPTAFFQNCAVADDPSCIIYTNCDPTIDYDPVAQTYVINNCDLVDCTAPSGQTPDTQAELAACALSSSGNTLTQVDGAWFFRDDGSAVPVLEAQLIFYFDTYAEYCNQTDPIPVFQLPPAQEALAPACAQPKYFRACPCCPPSGTFTVPPNATNDDPSQVDDFYTCTDGVPSCRCNDAAIGASNPPAADSIGYDLHTVPSTLSFYRFLDNRAQGYAYGQRLLQIRYELQAVNTIAAPQFYNDRSQCQLSIRNDNEFVRGSPSTGGADCLQGDIRGTYSRTCNLLNTAGPGPAVPCMIWYGQFTQVTSEAQCNCLIDSRATEDIPGFGTTIFNTISTALLNCAKNIVCARANARSSYWEEVMLIEKPNRNILLITLESAIVVGRHVIGTNADNVTVIGFWLVHPADNQMPLFDIDKAGDESDLSLFTVLNCNLFGSGCRKCGLVDSNRIDRMVVNYTYWSDFQYFALKLDDVDSLTLGGNTYNYTIGRSVLVQYNEQIIVDEAPMIDCRGGRDLNGAALMSFIAKKDDACDESDERHRCLIRGVKQHVKVTTATEHYRDQGLYFARGSLNVSRIYDNDIRLGQVGMTFIKTINIGSAQLPELMALNPGNRVSVHQTRDDPTTSNTWGPDYRISTVSSEVSEDGDTLFTFNDNVETDFDTAPYLIRPDALVCRSNLAWDWRYGFPEQLGHWPAPGVIRHGGERFHNASFLLEFCQDRRLATPLTGGAPALAFIGYIMSFNGSRIRADELTVYRDAWLIGDDTDACCTLPHWPPAIQGLGHRLLTRRLNMTDLAYFQPEQPKPADMWSSGPLQYDGEELNQQQVLSQKLPNELVLDRVLIDGLNILPAREMWGFRMLIGVEQPPEFFQAETNKLPPATSMYVEVRDTVLRNFPAFNADTAPDGANYIPGEYPVFNGMSLQAYNRLEATSVALFHNFSVENIDHTGLVVRYFNNLTVEGNTTFYNCSGRALGNEACFLIYGNDVRNLIVDSERFNATAYYLSVPINLLLNDTHFVHTSRKLFPSDDSGSRPGFVAHLAVYGYPTTADYCILNGSATGLPLAKRQFDTLNRTLLNCSYYPEPAPFAWPDRARYLRAQCIAGGLQHWEGFIHDLGFGQTSTDQLGETVWCDSDSQHVCCPLVDPEQCYVVQTPALLTPDNPWLGQYVFASLNDAIVNCNATRRQIYVIGSDDVFDVDDHTEKVYTEVISATVPVVSVRGLGGPLNIFSGAGVTWRSDFNRLATQCVQTTFHDFKFEDDGTSGGAIWDQTPPADDACALRFENNRWNLTVDGWAMRAVLSDHFYFADNLVRGNDISRHAVSLYNNGSCTDVDNVVLRNAITDVLGGGLEVFALNCYTLSHNDLRDVGGRDAISFTPYSMYAGSCSAVVPAPFVCVKIHTNKVRGTPVVPPLVGNSATCWWDPLPRFDKIISIEENDCKGLDFGQRYPPLPPVSLSATKSFLRYQCIQKRNSPSEGRKVPPNMMTFDLVMGDPVDDFSLVTQPFLAANYARWCTNCCTQINKWYFWAAVIALAVCVAFLCLMFLASGCLIDPRALPPIISVTTPPMSDSSSVSRANHPELLDTDATTMHDVLAQSAVTEADSQLVQRELFTFDDYRVPKSADNDDANDDDADDGNIIQYASSDPQSTKVSYSTTLRRRK